MSSAPIDLAATKEPSMSTSPYCQPKGPKREKDVKAYIFYDKIASLITSSRNTPNIPISLQLCTMQPQRGRGWRSL